MQPKYQDKEWLQSELNRLGTAQGIAEEYGWGKTTIARWIKRLEVSYPENFFKTTEEYHNKEWLKEKLEECGSALAISQKYGYGKTTISTWLHRHNLTEGLPAKTREAQKKAKETYQDKWWMEEKMEECGTAKAVADKYGFAETTIQRWAKKFGVNRSTTNPENAIYKNKSWLEVQFENGRSIQNIAEQFGLDRVSIQAQVSKHQIDTRKLQSKSLHPYKNKEWLREQVSIHGSGNKICKVHNLPTTSVNRYIKKYGLLPNTFQPAIKLELDENFFESIDSEEKAYWLGFMMADGYVHKKTTKAKISYLIGLKLQEKDAGHIELFKKTLQTNARIKEINGKRNGKIHKAREICFHNEKMASDLYSHGVIPKKTGKETVPKTVPENLIHHYIRGYFDGDGSASQAVFTVCCSHFMISQIKNLLEEQGVKKDSIHVYNRKSVQVMSVFKKEEVQKIVLWMYKDATIYLDRKRTIYIEKDRLSVDCPSVEQSTGVEGELLGNPKSFSTTAQLETTDAKV